MTFSLSIGGLVAIRANLLLTVKLILKEEIYSDFPTQKPDAKLTLSSCCSKSVPVKKNQSKKKKIYMEKPTNATKNESY